MIVSSLESVSSSRDLMASSIIEGHLPASLEHTRAHGSAAHEQSSAAHSTPPRTWQVKNDPRRVVTTPTHRSLIRKGSSD